MSRRPEIVRGKIVVPLIERVMAKVIYDHGCYTWTGAIVGKGYGVVGRHPSDPGSRLVHRIVFEDTNGPIGDGMQLDHLCRNTLCCNPIHLEPVSNAENTMRGAKHDASSIKELVCGRGHLLDHENARTTIYKGRVLKMCCACALPLESLFQERMVTS